MAVIRIVPDDLAKIKELGKLLGRSSLKLEMGEVQPAAQILDWLIGLEKRMKEPLPELPPAPIPEPEKKVEPVVESPKAKKAMGVKHGKKSK